MLFKRHVAQVLGLNRRRHERTERMELSLRVFVHALLYRTIVNHCCARVFHVGFEFYSSRVPGHIRARLVGFRLP